MTATPAASTTPPRYLRAPVPWLDLILLATAGAFVLRPLGAFWQANPDYAFGFGVPFLAAYLFGARWTDRPPAHPPAVAFHRLHLLLALGAISFLIYFLLVATVPDWRPDFWLGALCYVAACVGWTWLLGGRSWALHFAFPCAFLLLGVPWLYQLEFPILQTLMRGNAVLVADSLVLADIPARAAGNTLVLAAGQLGVEEACSGLLSLQSTLMLALFFGEFHRFTLRRRFVLLVLGLFFALLGNYLRLLFLGVQGARHGLPSVQAAHGSAGAAIFLLTLFALWISCLMLRPGESRSPTPNQLTCYTPSHSLAQTWALGLFAVVVTAQLFTSAWFACRGSNISTAQHWSVQFPAIARSVSIPAATHELLHDSASQAATWTDSHGRRWRAFAFDYPPEAVNRIAADLHNPEVCLSAAGFRETADHGEFLCPAGKRMLPVHAYAFAGGSAIAHVFWLRTPGAQPLNVVYAHSWLAPLARLRLWLGDAWHARRPAPTQTLEISIEDSPDFADARAAFAQFAAVAVRPQL